MSKHVNGIQCDGYCVTMRTCYDMLSVELASFYKCMKWRWTLQLNSHTYSFKGHPTCLRRHRRGTCCCLQNCNYKEFHSDVQGPQLCGCKSASLLVSRHVSNTCLMDGSSRLTPMNTIFCPGVPACASLINGLYCPYTLKDRLAPVHTNKIYFGTPDF